jgi:hypothetical protein
MGFDVEAICRASEAALARVREQGPEGVKNEPGMAPRFQCDTSLLPGEARRWRGWGFDAAGAALEMEIHVPD